MGKAGRRERQKLCLVGKCSIERDAPVQTVFKARVQVKKEFVSFSCFLSTTVFCTMSDRV
jgi:hypothetical protein